MRMSASGLLFAAVVAVVPGPRCHVRVRKHAPEKTKWQYARLRARGTPDDAQMLREMPLLRHVATRYARMMLFARIAGMSYAIQRASLSDGERLARNGGYVWRDGAVYEVGEQR